MMMKFVFPFLIATAFEYYTYKFLSRQVSTFTLFIATLTLCFIGGALLTKALPPYMKNIAKSVLQPTIRTSDQVLHQQLTVISALLILFPGLLTGLLGLLLILPPIQKLLFPQLKIRLLNEKGRSRSREHFRRFGNNDVIDVDVAKNKKKQKQSGDYELE